MNKQISAIVGIGILLLIVNYNIVHGQNLKPYLVQAKCIIHESTDLVILDLSCDEPVKAVVYYSSLGYEIKATLFNTIMYLQK
jgi:hypothetical protein